MPISVSTISSEQAARILEKTEGHFGDFKSKAIKPARLTKTLSAFANADGGELYVGIEEQNQRFCWNGFVTVEDANGHVQALEDLFPLGTNFRYTFMDCRGRPGAVLFCEIDKTSDIRLASNGVAYLRRGAQNSPASRIKK